MKKFKELKDKQKLLTVFGILGLVLILTGVTYAFFSYSKSGSTENTIKSGSITFWYDEINQSGNSISIEDALPMSDEAGKQQTAAFNFKIQSTTSSTTTIPYEITLRQKQGTDDIGSIVKVYLAKTSAVDASIASEEEVELSLFSELSNVTKNTYSEKLLHTDIVPASDSTYTQFYRLKMWVDNNTDYSQVENPTTHEMEYPYNNKTFTVMVNVYANGHVLDGNSGTATVNSVSVGGNELEKIGTENGIDNYETTLPEGTTSTTIAVDTGDYNQVTVTKTESDYTTPVAVNDNIQRLSNTVNRKVSLTDGNNYFKIVATSENGNGSKQLNMRIYVGNFALTQLIEDDNLAVYNNPTLTTSANNTSDASGLYKMRVNNGFGGANGDTYYFRGQVDNNKVKFANLDWRIVRINEDGTIRIILDTGSDFESYQSKFYSKYNDYSYIYYSNSDIKNVLENWYNLNISEDNATKVSTGNYFCEAARVKYDNNYTAGSASMTIFSSYTPDLKCSADGNGKGLINSSVGLITYDEVVLAGFYPRRVYSQNYLYKSFTWWTMSPTGYYQSGNVASSRIWKVQYNDFIGEVTANAIVYRPVINLKADVTATKDANGVYVVD